jgi:hypothetical protein
MTNAPRHNHSEDTFELLSAYIDDALDVVGRRQADAFVRDCTACALELEELRMLRQALRALPVPQPKRSFTLDPAVARPRMHFFPLLRFASLVSALLLVVILGVDALGSPRPEPMSATSLPASAESLSAPAQELSSAQTKEAPAAEDAAPAAAQGAPAAGGAMPETAAAIQEAPVGPPVEETAGIAAMASDMPEPTESAARVGKTPPEATAAAAQASDADAQNAAPPAGGSEASGSEEGMSALATSDTASQDTTTLEEAPAPAVAVTEQPTNRWLAVEMALAALTIVFGAGAWWTARRRF